MSPDYGIYVNHAAKAGGGPSGAKKAGAAGAPPGRDFYSYRWRPGGPCVGEGRDGYWKRREERRKKLRKQYQQKLQKEALARRLAQEMYDAEVSAANALRSRLLSSGKCSGNEGEVSPAAIDYEAGVIAQTMLSSLFRK